MLRENLKPLAFAVALATTRGAALVGGLTLGAQLERGQADIWQWENGSRARRLKSLGAAQCRAAGRPEPVRPGFVQGLSFADHEHLGVVGAVDVVPAGAAVARRGA